MRHVWKVSFFDKSFMFYRTDTTNIYYLASKIRKLKDVKGIHYISPGSMYYNDVMTEVVPSEAV